MVNLNQITKYLILSSLIANPLFAVKIDNIYDAVDIAGKQRMYTQRMLKDYAMVGMKNGFGKPAEDLKQVVADFDDHLNSLEKYTQSREIKKSTDKIKKIWSPIKIALSERPNKREVVKIQEQLEVLLKAANETTKLFAKETGTTSGKVVDISGRQRMLSQRMASLYLLKVWGVDDKQFKEKMQEAMKLFKESLVFLKESTYNTEEIDKQLVKVERSFKFFEVMNRSSSVFIPSLIYKKSDDILSSMNIITHCYVDASKEEN